MLLREEGGYSLIELLTTMAILSVILGGVVTLFVAGSNADADMNRRYRAQYNARLALDRLRRDAHGACGLATGYTSSSVTLYQYSGGACSSATFTWCTIGSGTRYALYRNSGTTCAVGPRYADYLTTGAVFTYTPQNTPSGTYTLARLTADFQINLTPTKTVNAYRLRDDVAFRNSPRS